MFLLALVFPALGHEHHDQLTEEEANAPVDAVLLMYNITTLESEPYDSPSSPWTRVTMAYGI